jgi:DhnA family fructose-bisphosphate aldolase class Ia
MPRPVLLRGGEKGEEADVLKYAQDLIQVLSFPYFTGTKVQILTQLLQAGASGLVYGRNIIHHEDPTYITRKFMEKVHAA